MRPCLPIALCLLLTACGEGESLIPPDARLPDGANYRGELVNGRLQGAGRLDYPNGDWYEGQFEKGLLQGQGTWHNRHYTYTGEFHQGEFSGKGRLQHSNGDLYEGQLKNGSFEGEGRFTGADGSSYHGGFHKDLYNGLGTLVQADGSRHIGVFSKGQPNGLGAYQDSYGNSYYGTFKNGQLNGQGTFQNRQGGHYNGEFTNSQFNGKGRFESQGDIWTGRFAEDELLQGEYFGSDGSHYEGQFSNWKYQGEGKLQLANGEVQSGYWENGQHVRDEQGKDIPSSLEVALLEQGPLLQKALDAIPASTPAVELYGLSLGGDGSQSVFLREAEYTSKLLKEQFASRGVITLVNHRDHLTDLPLATQESLARALRTLAERSGPEDLLFIYLTSHGSWDHELQLDQPGLGLRNLPAKTLAELLKPLANRYKVLVVSACYSGGFIPPIKDDKTLIMTASREDRVSFGCSEDAEFTYFGEALLKQGLPKSNDLKEAFALARKRVQEREEAEDFKASDPQIWAPEGVLERWQMLRKAQIKELAGQDSVN